MAEALQQSLLEQGSSSEVPLPSSKQVNSSCGKLPTARGILCTASLLLSAVMAVTLLGFPGQGQLPFRSTTVETTMIATPHCHSEDHRKLLLQDVELAHRKGLAMDDTTWDSCPGSIPTSWPATSSSNKVTNVRIFRSASKLKTGIHSLRQFLVHNSGKALLGTPITCNQEDDDAEWDTTVESLGILGPERVLGVAIGNELDLLPIHPNNCSKVGGVWGYFMKNLQRRVNDLKYVHGGIFANVSVTTVMAGSVLKCGDYACTPGKMTLIPGFQDVLKFIYTVLPPERFVLSINYYPYFQPCPPLGDDHTQAALSCDGWFHLASCVDDVKCVVRQSLIATRLAVQSLVGEKGRNLRIWVGELGWSNPSSSTLNPGACNANSSGLPRVMCPSWSSPANLAAAYSGFLKWDLSVGPGFAPVEMAFWFSIRDSVNFGAHEHFGLCGSAEACSDHTSKVCGGSCEMYES
jgi:hypothetical protein